MKKEKNTFVKKLLLTLALTGGLIMGQSFSNEAVSFDLPGNGGICRCHFNANSCESGNRISFRARYICSYSHCVNF